MNDRDEEQGEPGAGRQEVEPGFIAAVRALHGQCGTLVVHGLMTPSENEEHNEPPCGLGFGIQDSDDGEDIGAIEPPFLPYKRGAGMAGAASSNTSIYFTAAYGGGGYEPEGTILHPPSEQSHHCSRA